MAIEVTHEEVALTPEQLAVVKRARNADVVVSRSHRRPPGDRKWSHRPAIVLARDIDLVELLKRERQRRAERIITESAE